MRQLKVSLGERSYPILIGESLYTSLGDLFKNAGIKKGCKILVITDEQVAPFYLRPVMEELVRSGYQVVSSTVPAGEQSKSLAIYDQVISEAIEYELDRNSMIVALGGGVVGDLSGFVAATYMRGIPFAQLPTTLLAHDSSVGGKVALNHPRGKNMIGAFYQPTMVIYDLKALRTLPNREIYSGFAEIIKHAIIWDKNFFCWLDEHATSLLQLQSDYLQDAIFRSCQIKAHVVSEDERERGLRAILNFGHTVGHALESYYGYQLIAHGEGVAIGMVVASKVGAKMGSMDIEGEVTEILRKFHLPTNIPNDADLQKVLSLIYHDKKVKNHRILMVLPEKIGKVKIEQPVEPELLLATMREMKQERKAV